LRTFPQAWHWRVSGLMIRFRLFGIRLLQLLLRVLDGALIHLADRFPSGSYRAPLAATARQYPSRIAQRYRTATRARVFSTQPRSMTPFTSPMEVTKQKSWWVSTPITSDSAASPAMTRPFRKSRRYAQQHPASSSYWRIG
jgi:hypothetical protein